MKTFLEFLENDNLPQNTLKKFASHYDNFKDFEKSFLFDINHGYYWHITDDPHFSPSTEKGPKDMSSIASGKVKEPGALMVTSHLDYWDAEYNDPEITRPYAALLDLSDIDPRMLKQVSRGFGNEFYLTPDLAKKVKLVEVMPIERARTTNRRLHSTIPDSSQKLMDIWKSVHR
jgi:hypothetical protein